MYQSILLKNLVRSGRRWEGANYFFVGVEVPKTPLTLVEDAVFAVPVPPPIQPPMSASNLLIN
jgi:hypothetical protein